MKNTSYSPEILALRQAIVAAKTRHRRAAARAPILEKLRILEEMRDFTVSLRGAREEHKARVQMAWAQP